MTDALTMPKNDFLKPLLNMMTDRMDRLEEKIDANTSLTQTVKDEIESTNHIVSKHGDSIKTLQHALAGAQRKTGRKLDFNPSFIYLLALGAVLLLLVIASLLKVNLSWLP